MRLFWVVPQGPQTPEPSSIGLLDGLLVRSIALQGDKAAACAAYQKAIAAAAERGADGGKAYVHLTVQFAHFLLVVYKDLEGARSAYSLALEKLPRSQTLWEGAIHLEQVSGAPVSTPSYPT
jgi:hypothetical protein